MSSSALNGDAAMDAEMGGGSGMGRDMAALRWPKLIMLPRCWYLQARARAGKDSRAASVQQLGETLSCAVQ